MGLRNWLTGAPSTKASVTQRLMALVGMGQPNWTPRNIQKFVDEGYVKNTILFSVIDRVATAVSAIPVVIKVGNTELDAGDVVDLLSNPNPGETRSMFVRSVVTHKRLGGNAYVESVGVTQPRELYSLRPERVRIIVGDRGAIARYEYWLNGGKVEFPTRANLLDCDLLHMKEFHPGDDFLGLGRTNPVAFAVDVHNSSSSWIKSLLDNAARPSGAFVFDPKGENANSTMTEPQYARLKSQMEENYSGPKNSGRPMLLEGGLSWVPMGSTPLEMDFFNTRNQMAREICIGGGVPPMLMGIPGDNTYSNYAEANAAFHRDTVIPEAQETYARLAQWLGPKFGISGLKIEPDVDKIPALAGERGEVWDRMEAASFLSEEEKREALGYTPKPKAGETVRGLTDRAIEPGEDRKPKLLEETRNDPPKR